MSHRRALAIREKVLGPDHLDVVSSLNNLGKLYVDQGQYEKAEPLCKRALATSEKVLGPDHADVAVLLKNMAEVYRKTGRGQEAENFDKRAAAITANKAPNSL